jgi:hypothetical protein
VRDFNWQLVGLLAGGFVAVTGLIAIVRLAQKWTSPLARRKRVVDKNKTVVETINRYLPNNREALTPGETGTSIDTRPAD